MPSIEKIYVCKRKGTFMCLLRKEQIVNKGKFWVGFQSYSKTTTLFTQQRAQNSTFSWKDLVVFSKLHIKNPHTMATFSLTGHQRRELAHSFLRWSLFTAASAMLSGDHWLKTMKKRLRDHHAFPLKAVVEGHFLIFFPFFPLLQ